MTVRVMSADSHMDLIYLPPDTFSARMPARWGDRTPHVAERNGLKAWISGGDVLGPFQKDVHGVRAMAEIAPDNVMWGSDYPHRDGTWPFSPKAIAEQFRGIDEAIQQKMLWENVRRVYGLDR